MGDKNFSAYPGHQELTPQDQVQQKMPKRLMVAGKYKSLPSNGKLDPGSLQLQRSFPFMGLLSTNEWVQSQSSYFSSGAPTMIKCFEYESKSKKGQESPDIEITALEYGPYDNGHIILGFNTGFLLILNSLDLSGMFRIQVFEPYLQT